MTLPHQILWGSIFLCLSIAVQAFFIGGAAHAMLVIGERLKQFGRSLHVGGLLAIALSAIILALTAQVWLWAWVYIKYDILSDWNSAVYFSLVTFTSLGYGDITLGPELRIFAAFGAVTGLLAFGLNTAFMVSSMSRRFGE